MMMECWPFNPSLPDPVNFVPFGMMKYSFFEINLNAHEHNLHMICIFAFLFLNKTYTFLFEIRPKTIKGLFAILAWKLGLVGDLFF